MDMYACHRLETLANQHWVGPQTAGHEAARFTPLVFGGSQEVKDNQTKTH